MELRLSRDGGLEGLGNFAIESLRVNAQGKGQRTIVAAERGPIGVYAYCLQASGATQIQFRDGQGGEVIAGPFALTEGQIFWSPSCVPPAFLFGTTMGTPLILQIETETVTMKGYIAFMRY